MLNKNGQVWIETVLYTLIGISLIALVLAFAMPKINEMKDKAVVEQTINSLNSLDDRINVVLQATGNKRLWELTIKRGEFYINSSTDEAIIVISDLGKPYMEVGSEVDFGKVKVASSQGSKYYIATMRLDYSNELNITYMSDDLKDVKFSPAPTPYRFTIESTGISSNYQGIDIVESSGR